MRPPYLLRRRTADGKPELVAVVTDPGSKEERERAIEWARTMFRDSDVDRIEVQYTPGTARAIKAAEEKRARKKAAALHRGES